MKTRSVRDHRDIAAQAASVSYRQATLTELSQHGIEVDDRIVIAHEGLSLDTGGYSARWRRVRNVYLSELVDSRIGDLPDRSVIPPRRGGVAIPSPKEEAKKLFASTMRTLMWTALLTNPVTAVIRLACRTSPLVSWLIDLVITVIVFRFLRRSKWGR
jgi:hypothetical protein